MSAFDYSNYNDPKEIGSDNPHRRECPYCGDRLKYLSLNDIWSVSDAELLEIHEDTKRVFREVHDLEDCYLNLEMDTKSIDVDLHYCQTCGWWRVVKDICIAADQ
jgi:restriction system protein